MDIGFYDYIFQSQSSEIMQNRNAYIGYRLKGMKMRGPHRSVMSGFYCIVVYEF